MVILAKVHVVHGNLSPKNVILCGDEITDTSQLKLVNWGQGIELDGNSNTFNWKIDFNDFIAPEMEEGRMHRSTDIYSFGKILKVLIDEDQKKQRLEVSKKEDFNWERILKLAEKMTVKEEKLRPSV